MTHIDPDHGGVTDTDLERYIQQRMASSPLAPVVPGQQAVTPPFRPGQGAPPPPNIDETQPGFDPTPSNPYRDEIDPEADPDAPPDDDEEEDEEPDEEIVELPDPDAPPEEEPEPSQPTAPVSSLPIINGRQMTEGELQALAELDTLLRYDPALRDSVQTHLQSRGGNESGVDGATQPTPSAPVQIPAELLDDPAIAALYQQAQSQSATIQTLQQQMAQTTDVVMNRERAETESVIKRVSQSFANEKQLSEDAVQNLGITATRMNLLSPLMAGVDPITGAAVPVDREYAARRALEIAYWSVPEYRDREYATQVKQRAKDQQRKQRLAGIGGTGGSVQRSVPIPNTPHERQAAAVRDMAEMMGLPTQE